MSRIVFNRTRRDGASVLVREEDDGCLYGYVVALEIERKVFKHAPHRGGREFTTRVGKTIPRFVFTCPLGLASAGIWKSGQEQANATLREFEKASAAARAARKGA